MNQHNAYKQIVEPPATSVLPAPIRAGGGYASIEQTLQPLLGPQPKENHYQQHAKEKMMIERGQEQYSGDFEFKKTNELGAHSSRLVRHVPQTTIYDPSKPSYYTEPPIQLGDEVVVQQYDDLGESTRSYPDVFPDKPFLQLPQANLILNPVPFYISADSRDRNRDACPQTNNYRIPLVTSSTNPAVKSTGDRLKNIYSISLLSCVVPNTPGVFDQPYLLLQIDEIDGLYDAANAPTTRAMTKLYFREACAGSKFLRLDKGVGDPTTRIYWPAPRASLEQLTISFRNYDGTLFDFGADTTPPTAPNTELQTTITLEIRTFVPDADTALGHRNP